MRFLVDEDIPRSTDDLLRRYEHEAVDVRDIGLRGAKDPQIAAYAQSEDLCLVTGDFDFSDIRNYPPGEYAGVGGSEPAGDDGRRTSLTPGTLSAMAGQRPYVICSSTYNTNSQRTKKH